MYYGIPADGSILTGSLDIVGLVDLRQIGR